MKTTKEFNEAHIDLLDLSDSGDGLNIEVPSVVQYLNQIFKDLRKIEGFKYKEISTIHGIPRMDTNLDYLFSPMLGRIIHEQIEKDIILILKVEFEVEQRLLTLNLDKYGNTIEV